MTQVLPMTQVSSPHRLHYPMQVSMGNKSQVNPDSYHTTRSLGDKHDRVSSLRNITFRVIPQISYTHTELRYQGYLTPIRLEFSLTPSNMHSTMNVNHFQTKVFVFNRGQPSDINSGQTPIIYFVDNPPMYINWTDSND